MWAGPISNGSSSSCLTFTGQQLTSCRSVIGGQGNIYLVCILFYWLSISTYMNTPTHTNIQTRKHRHTHAHTHTHTHTHIHIPASFLRRSEATVSEGSSWVVCVSVGVFVGVGVCVSVCVGVCVSVGGSGLSPGPSGESTGPGSSCCTLCPAGESSLLGSWSTSSPGFSWAFWVDSDRGVSTII